MAIILLIHNFWNFLFFLYGSDNFRQTGQDVRESFLLSDRRTEGRAAGGGRGAAGGGRRAYSYFYSNSSTPPDPPPSWSGGRRSEVGRQTDWSFYFALEPTIYLLYCWNSGICQRIANVSTKQHNLLWCQKVLDWICKSRSINQFKSFSH